MRALRVEGLVNARDLGGLPLTGGGTTPCGVFFRSENVDTVTARGWDELHDLGVRTVVDLRQDAERERDRSRRPDWLATVHVDLDGLENVDFWRGYADNGLWGTAAYFLPHLAAMPERAGAALAAVADADEGGVLFHCMAGRDRTGLVAMLLLRLVGADPDAIVDDYLETVRNADALAQAAGRENDEPLREAILARRGSCTEGAFRDAVGGLDIDTFLAAAGLSGTTVQRLRTWRASVVPTRSRRPAG
ncbi:tyrosine-protein phosphatase [Cellulomonas xiejunii]|uniref:tyrosine-protein phosphatase n=1 Tax=Cellulomonas xiejunii TaxID=2968083 RepID=UPI001D0E0E61|nr:tyrosine-protein phosphatase [Cellulomonas xiejunii]MCC2314503.1 tyrosine-protein phosphatase [Cellulomonas xiejunii]